MVSLADGHGSYRHIRSASGSQFACDVFQDLGKDLLRQAYATDSLDRERFRAIADRPIAEHVVRRWRRRVLADTRPPTAIELDLLKMNRAAWEDLYFVNPQLKSGE